MPDFNFTVQAVDDLGLTASRDFSITVNNTSVDKVILVGTTGLIRSPDGINWRSQGGFDSKGLSVVWADDRWIKITDIGSTPVVNLHESLDGIVWTPIAANLAPFSPFLSSGIQTAASLTYVNSTLYMLATKISAGGVQLFVSTDKGLTWVSRPIPFAFGGPSPAFYGLWRKICSDGTPGTIVFPIKHGEASGSITLNGVTATSSEVMFVKSIDNGITWTASKATVALQGAINGFQFINGKYCVLFTYTFSGTFAGNYTTLFTSTNGSLWSNTNINTGYCGDLIYVNGVTFNVNGPAVSGSAYALTLCGALAVEGPYQELNFPLHTLDHISGSGNIIFSNNAAYGAPAYLIEALANRIICMGLNRTAGTLPDSALFVGGSVPISTSWITDSSPVLIGSYNAGALQAMAVRNN